MQLKYSLRVSKKNFKVNIARPLRQVRETDDFTKSSKAKNARITKLT